MPTRQYSYNRTSRTVSDVQVDDNLKNFLETTYEAINEEFRAIQWLSISLETLEKAHAKTDSYLATLHRQLRSKDPTGIWLEKTFGPNLSEAVLDEDLDAGLYNKAQLRSLRDTLMRLQTDARQTADELRAGIYRLPV